MTSEEGLSAKLSANASEIPPRKPPQVKMVTVFIGLISECLSKEYGTRTEINLEKSTIKIAIIPSVKYPVSNFNRCMAKPIRTNRMPLKTSSSTSHISLISFLVGP